MNKQNIGYVTANFPEKEKIEIINWSKNINDKNLYFAKKDGIIDGGNVTDDLHLTLFYGFDEDKINKNDITKIIDNINLGSIEIGNVNTFSFPDQEYKVLYLTIKDNEGKIKEYHEKLKKLPHFVEYQKFKFTPHVAIAFLKKEFDETRVTYNGPRFLHIKKIVYHSKGKKIEAN
jgi:2'-5' RNA ligase